MEFRINGTYQGSKISAGRLLEFICKVGVDNSHAASDIFLLEPINFY